MNCPCCGAPDRKAEAVSIEQIRAKVRAYFANELLLDEFKVWLLENGWDSELSLSADEKAVRIEVRSGENLWSLTIPKIPSPMMSLTYY